MQLDSLKPRTKNRKIKRLGRGGNRGKTSGRGTKGQKARSGHRIRPEIRDMIKKLPKRRGHGKNRTQSLSKPILEASVALGRINKAFSAGAIVSPDALFDKRLVRRMGGVVPHIKILASGEITKKLVFVRVQVSKTAKEAIEKAGGVVKSK